MNTRIALAIMLLLLFQITGCAIPEERVDRYKSDDQLVLFAHGLGRGDSAMWELTQRLEGANYKVCRLDYPTIGESVSGVLVEISKQSDACIARASKVHYVGHSLGGLVIRA